MDEKEQELKHYRRALGIACCALATYADPDFYHAIVVFADRPAGGFADDFSEVPESGYNRPMSGKLARDTLDKLTAQFPNLVIDDDEETEKIG